MHRSRNALNAGLMAGSPLFEPLALGDLTLSNRIVVAPMCQYSAVDGCATDWHMIHLGHLALSGAGLMILEATGVLPEGRITRDCLGLYSDACETALARVLETVRRHSAMPLAIQLSHAGRKASTLSPFAGRGRLEVEHGGWQVMGPSAIPWQPDWHMPVEMDAADLRLVRDAFVEAARRSRRLGFAAIELHAAHGYLLSSFLSPLANQRLDGYGGTARNRARFPLEVVSAVREVWSDRPLGVRINGTDWHPGGISPDEAVDFAGRLKEAGVDFVDVSSGGNAPVNVPLAPGYQVPFAARVRREAGIPTIVAGLIREPRHAEAIIRNGNADMIAMARGFLNDPRWPWHAAEDLGAVVDAPKQYARALTRAGTPGPNARSS